MFSVLFGFTNGTTVNIQNNRFLQSDVIKNTWCQIIDFLKYSPFQSDGPNSTAVQPVGASSAVLKKNFNEEETLLVLVNWKRTSRLSSYTESTRLHTFAQNEHSLFDGLSDCPRISSFQLPCWPWSPLLSSRRKLCGPELTDGSRRELHHTVTIACVDTAGTHYSIMDL